MDKTRRKVELGTNGASVLICDDCENQFDPACYGYPGPWPTGETCSGYCTLLCPNTVYHEHVRMGIEPPGNCMHCRDRKDALWLETQQSKLGDYDNPPEGCPKCQRMRIMVGDDGRHRCEKCGWCIEMTVLDYDFMRYTRGQNR